MKALHNITYGLYVLTAKGENMNGCIINTLMQVTSTPERISITVNKDNFTTKIIERTRQFNVSILNNSASFEIFERFGFSSGKTVDKFKDFNGYKLAKNEIAYIVDSTNAYLSCKVIETVDLGTHLTFIADVTEEAVLKDLPPLTYAYYLKNIKPKSNPQNKGVFVCRVCGYVYEGDELPKDFICPICKHGVVDFEFKDGTRKEEQKQYYCPVCDRIEKSAVPLETCILCGGELIVIEN